MNEKELLTESLQDKFSIMVDSGIKLSNECVEAFRGFHKAPQKYRFCVFGFNEKLDKVVLIHAAPLNATFEDLLVVLAEHKACYVFYDCHFKTKEGHQRNKVNIINNRKISLIILELLTPK